jgi:hypothetical protein
MAPANWAAWLWNLTTSPWSGVVEPARHLAVLPATGRGSAVRPVSGVAGRVAGDRVVDAIMAGRLRRTADPG